MVRGFDSFRERFRGYEDCYTIIGGTACDILMSEVGLDFRATKDIDMILLIEERFAEFAAVFWGYIRDGGYKCGWKNSDVPHFYRFTEPQAAGYPAMIELFSRRPEFQARHPEIHLTPLPVSDDISSLSAIMLDDNYYQLMLMTSRIYGWTTDSVHALNLIDVVFANDVSVRTAWRNLLEAYSSTEQSELMAKKRHNLMYKLLDAMAENLGYKNKITWEAIQNPYIPQGMVDIMTAQAKSKQAYQELLNNMNTLTTQQPQSGAERK